MHKGKRNIILVVLGMLASVALFMIVKGRVNAENYAASPSVFKNDQPKIVQYLSDNRIVNVGSWVVEENGSTRLHYIVKEVAQDTNAKETEAQFSIFTQSGELLYEEHFMELESAYPSYILRQVSPQLLVTVNYGGGTNFLKILDYQQGKIVDLMDAIKPNNSFTISAEVRPQLRTGVNPASEVFQVLLTDGVGLASPVEKSTHLFRFANGSYRYAGSFSPQKVDDFMEKLVTESHATKK